MQMRLWRIVSRGFNDSVWELSSVQSQDQDCIKLSDRNENREEEGKCVNLEYNIQNTLTISHDTSMNFNRNRVVQL